MTMLWIALGVAGWLVLAAVLAVGIGHAVYLRDRQVPRHRAVRTGELGRHHERTRT